MVNEGKREFWKYAIYTAVTSLPVAHMFYTMWTDGTWRYASSLANSVRVIPDGTTGVIAGLLFGLGVYLGLLLLFMQNRRKYYQGALFLLGTVVTLALLGLLGIGIPGFEPSLMNLGAFVAGMVLVAFAETIDTDRSIPLTEGVEFEGRLHQIDPERSSWGDAVDARGNQLEFPIATYGLIGFIIGVVSLANLMNFIVAEPQIGMLQLFHAASSLAFLTVMSSFLTLDPSSETNLQILGPTQSGKTYFVLATALEADRSDQFEMTRAEGWINELVEEHNEWAQTQRRMRDEDFDQGTNQDADDEVDWDIDFTPYEETNQTDFTVVVNDRIPKALNFNVVDHAGELLTDVADRIGNPAVTDGGDESPSLVCKNCTSGIRDPSLRLGDECPKCGEDGGLTKPSDDDEERDNDRVDYDDSSFDIDRFTGPSDDNMEESEQEESTSSENDPSASETEPEDENETTAADTDTKNNVGSERVDGATADSSAPKEVSPDRSASEEETREGSSSSNDETQQSPINITDASGEALVSENEIVDRLVKKIVESDTLVMMLDCWRLIGGQPAGDGSGSLGTTQMNRIINEVEPDRVVLVATKADVLIDDWKDWYRTQNGGSLDQDRLPNPHELDQYQRSFQQYITKRFRNETGILLKNAGVGSVYPVYFETQRTERDTKSSGKKSDDAWKPKPNANGELQQHGYEEVLAAIARDST